MFSFSLSSPTGVAVREWLPSFRCSLSCMWRRGKPAVHSLRPPVCVCAGMSGWADPTGCQRQRQPTPTPPVSTWQGAPWHECRAARVALDHLGGYWMAARLPFRNNLARSKFIRVNIFGCGCSAVVLTAFGPVQAPPPPPRPLGPELPNNSAGSRESH